ncbi:site-specific DNA-methyltransferase [Flavobacterium gawalongense]|uniref:site-specific DNA-methyltransferase (adenine-specific) n=2 Tax=Flavobacterium gawalongense TaxID=2594432 RepID=A0A553BWQ7_9FLAO|nr:site-specific DNA-methyltransferase [Flavobacterium gawalongense]TRX12752.1 site-specific DNA-methyltransferase [Flavobacterium gawalongense]TRX30591.1 site-specific DNA-methyltransferase [Flavobacterium gawalongense]
MPLSTDWNNERLQILKQQFPDWFTSEGSLNIEEVKKAVNPDSVSETERYEFRWFGKSQAKRNAFTASNATLVYDEHRSVNPTESENIIIEGENLEVLKLLSGSYREKIKCIYIDPPYNTGKDFVYSDNFTQDKKAYWQDAEVLENGVKIDTNAETDGRYHSNWLNMMYSRLLIARQLLKEDGVIFISIDDNEVHHLRKLCDEVFGEENFVANFIWKSRQNKDNRTITGASIDHEYIICYSRNNESKALKGSERKVEQYTNPDLDPRGDWASGNMVGILPENLRPNCHYDLTNPNTGINYGKPKMGWRYDMKTMSRLIEEDRILWPNSIEGRPRRKVFLDELSDSFTGFSSIIGKNIFTRDGTKEVDDLFNYKAFDFPKPPSLIEELISQVTEEDDVVLDFFGGSGSTGQAVFELNKDNDNRKFILIQIPEVIDSKSEAYKAGYKKISDITIERNKRVIAKIITEKESQQPDLFAGDKKEDKLKGLGFKVFKLQKSNFPRVDFAPNPEFNETENIELLKKYIAEKESQLVNAFNKEELLTEILLKNNFTLNYTVTAQEQFKKNEILLATDDNKETLICLDVSIEPETVDYFKVNTGQKFICLERALDTTKKYNLKHYLGDKFNAF